MFSAVEGRVIMKRLIMSGIVAILLLVMPSIASTLEEEDLPSESAPSANIVHVETVTFTGYVNSKDVTIVADMLAAVYNFCRERDEEFCSDEQGVLVVSASEEGRVVDLIKKMDTAVDEEAMVLVYLSRRPYYGGIRRIMDVRIDY
jgi:hypothetical protein